MSTSKKIVKQALPIVLAVGLTVAVMLGIMYYYRRIPSHGVIKTVNLDAFVDSACTQKCTEVDWGFVTPDSTTNRTIYIKNTSNVPINITINTANWNPTTASQYITLSYEIDQDVNVPVNAVVKTVLMLKVSLSVTGFTNFSVDIIITGSG